MAKRGAEVRPELHLILSDFHFPDFHKGLWRAVLSFAERNAIDGVTWLGDQLDLAEIAHHNMGKPGLKKAGALRANLDAYGECLDELDARLSPDAVKRWHYGNHERFIQDYYEATPELEGMLDLEHHLRLDERGYRVFRLGKMSRLGHLGLVHGDQIGSGQYVARKLVDTQCMSMVMGHVHTASSFTKVSASNSRRKWCGWTLPTMGTINPRYARNRANMHVHGFGIAEVMPSRQFNLFPVIADSVTGSFAYGGQFYDGAVYRGRK